MADLTKSVKTVADSAGVPFNSTVYVNPNDSNNNGPVSAIITRAGDLWDTTVIPVAGAAGGATPYHLRSAASNNATSLKASAGTVYGWHITNNSTTTAYRVKFYNKASAPAPASDTPVYVLTIPAAFSAAQPTIVTESGLSVGIAFATGIAFAIVAGDSDTDNTAVTTLGDINLNIKYK